MRAYKYRSLKNFEHVADIFCNKRFYATQFFDLNDPMEGMFDYEKGTKKRYLDEIRIGKKKLRICSFSSHYSNLLLWAHYADGFKGICIDVELYDYPDHEIVKVNYDYFKPIFNNEQGKFAHFWPRIILREKNIAWKYEKEIRVLTGQEYISYPAVEIRSVYFGVRTPASLKEALLRMVPEGVLVYETSISRNTNRVIKGRQVNQPDELH